MIGAHDPRSHEERILLAATALEEASARLVKLAERMHAADAPWAMRPLIREECDLVRAAIGQVSDHMLRLYMDVIAEELAA